MPLRWYRMNSYANYIETIIEHEPENKLLEASALYSQSFSTIPEMTYYKALERMCKKGILVHLTKGLYYRPKIHGLVQSQLAKKTLLIII